MGEGPGEGVLDHEVLGEAACGTWHVAWTGARISPSGCATLAAWQRTTMLRRVPAAKASTPTHQAEADATRTTQLATNPCQVGSAAS